MKRYIVEIEVNTTVCDFREDIKDEIESLGLTVISVQLVNPNDAFTTVSYSAETIRQHLKNTVESDDERMKLLHLVTDEQLEDIAVKEVIENDYCLDHIHQNMVSILWSATEKLKPQEKFTVMLGKLKDYLASNPSFRTGQHWESGFAHGAFGLPCGGEPSEIEGYAAGKLWAEEYDREV